MTHIFRIGWEAGLIPASDHGWARRALAAGHAAAAVRAFMGYDDGSGLGDALLPDTLEPRGPVPDFWWMRAGLLVASDAMLAAIEALDPGRHRFWPIDLGTQGRAHGLIVRAFARAIAEDGSRLHVEPPEPLLGLPRHASLIGHAARVDPARLPDAHLWWDQALSKPYLMASDALAARIAPLATIPLRRCR
ncbi:hypothetical protein [Jannaschia aquimarina]|uniref:Immunity MXAN-0049 protein domain-containing protein n=1 Tax=Jannaschia aquimarina TaxID=935700 RepID=A0A0D1ENL0_9RHOB|nr:hypothetical protein [Jannaschia aquimarina]KIT17245.1 hypothetical protein jaqu_09760 [Jannaschia aquimarina]SNT19034.1 hypothetical protein SAMN05421775_107102 [Jannaschia aquimarina]